MQTNRRLTLIKVPLPKGDFGGFFATSPYINEYLSGQRKAYILVGGKHQYFPKRRLETIEYSIEDTYNGLYQQLRQYLGKSSKQKSLKTLT